MHPIPIVCTQKRVAILGVLSNHVETLALLSNQDVNNSLVVKMDNLALTSSESKATYKQIKEYVLKNYNLHVSTLYISQVKRSCGLEVGDSYYKSQKTKQHIPKCPEAKAKAIKETLKHFKML